MFKVCASKPPNFKKNYIFQKQLSQIVYWTTAILTIDLKHRWQILIVIVLEEWYWNKIMPEKFTFVQVNNTYLFLQAFWEISRSSAYFLHLPVLWILILRIIELAWYRNNSQWTCVKKISQYFRNIKFWCKICRTNQKLVLELSSLVWWWDVNYQNHNSCKF